MFLGSLVALVTPMDATGAVAEESLRALIHQHLCAGTDGLVILGTTGEAPTLTAGERERVIRITVDEVKGRIPVIAGTGTYSTLHTVHETEQARALGVDACLLITPYYNRPTQEGLYQHYRVIAESVAVPIIVYNAPQRTGCDLLPETIERLSHVPHVVGVKECNETMTRIQEVLTAAGGRLAVYTGTDAMNLSLLSAGGQGVISVTANVVPQKMHNFCRAALAGESALAEQMDRELMALHQSLFVESNPIPVKWALQEMGWIPSGIRLPLTTLSEQYHARVRAALQQNGVETSAIR